MFQTGKRQMKNGSIRHENEQPWSSGSLAIGKPGLKPNLNDRRVLTAAFHISNAGSLNQIGQPREPVVARVKIRGLFGKVRADPCKVGFAVLLRRRADCLPQLVRFGLRAQQRRP